jgi:manganese transport protein
MAHSPSARASEDNAVGVPGRQVASGRPPVGVSFWRKLVAFTGPAYLVAVGYMDPGNWATDLAGGSRFGYQLLSVVVLSNLMALVLQSLSARLGIVTGMDLARACRVRYGPSIRIMLWLLCEVAIIACELAEVIGTAVALGLLFGLPLAWGVCLTTLNVIFISLLERSGARRLEASSSR